MATEEEAIIEFIRAGYITNNMQYLNGDAVVFFIEDQSPTTINNVKHGVPIHRNAAIQVSFLWNSGRRFGRTLRDCRVVAMMLVAKSRFIDTLFLKMYDQSNTAMLIYNHRNGDLYRQNTAMDAIRQMEYGYRFGVYEKVIGGSARWN